MAGVPPLPLPPPQAMPAVRVDVPLSDGSYAQQLVASDGSAAYQFLRTLQEALMGKVKSAVVCARAGGAAWAPPAPGAPHTLVAVKQLLKSCVRERRTRAGKPVQEDPLREVAVLRMLQARAGAGAAAAADVAQRHVMRLISFLEDEKYFFIVYEFLDGGELFSQVQAHGKVPEARAARHFFDTLMGTRFCHDCAVAHRDLSLENVMLTGGGGGGGGGGAGAEPASPAAAAVATAKLIDFGLAVVMPPAGTLLAWDGRVGKERYMAPETYAGQAYDGRSIDVWCLGMMLFVMLFGVYPYAVPCAALCPYFQQIAEGNFLPMVRGWGYGDLVSADALLLLDRMLTVDPLKRATTEEVLASPWLRAQVAAREAEVAAGKAAVADAARPAAAMSIDDGSFLP